MSDFVEQEAPQETVETAETATDDEGLAVSEAEQLNIASHLLLSSPPGQFTDVLEDVRKLVPPSVLTEERIAALARTYNLACSRLIQHGPHKFILSREGEDDATHYLDTVATQVLEVDHVKAEVVPGCEPMAPPDNHADAMRKALGNALAEYRNSQFTAASCASAAFTAGEGKYALYISAEQLNLRNWWSGSWSGQYQVQIGEEEAIVSGRIAICGHYFENGNIQLRTRKEMSPVSVPIPSGTNDAAQTSATAAAVVKQIRSAEDTLQAALDEMYLSMSEGTLRSLRRAVPVNAEKFSWQINQIKMRNTLVAARK